jgi:hypothetical protein
LQGIRLPGFWRSVLLGFGAAPFVFIRHPFPISLAGGIYFSGQAQAFAGKLKTAALLAGFRFYFCVISPAGKDAIIGNADFFNLLQIKESLTVLQRM